MKNNKSCCPACGEHLRPTYMKQTCPKCEANLLYYKMDERLEQDRIQAEKEVNAIKSFLLMLKNSTIKTPWHIVRLVTFFLPLATMCLPMFWAGHKNVSLISFIMSIINHGFDIGAIAGDKSYLFAVLSIVFVIVLSLCVIISSLFSASKNGHKRNIFFSVLNTLAFGIMSYLVVEFGGRVKVGFYATLAIYALEFLLHYVTVSNKNKRNKLSCALAVIACVLLVVPTLPAGDTNTEYMPVGDYVTDITAVSFNVASAFGTGIEDTDSMDRCSRFAQYMFAQKPDFIGTQETNSYWVEALKEELTGYDSYAVKRGGDSEEKNSEMNAVFWNSDRFSAIYQDTFWLSSTPDKESKYTYIDADGENQEAGCNRICSYVVLQDTSTRELYLFMNTHLDNSSEEARVFGANVILDKMEDIKSEYDLKRIVLTGDFNETSDGEAYKLLASRLKDTTYEPVAKATYQEWGYKQTVDMPIDFIFTDGDDKQYLVLDDLSNGYISDHYGIMSLID